jgi:predicted RNA-binding protein
VDFLPSREVDIHPMLDSLSFIPDKRHWGAPFRFGMLEIPAEDYERIAAEMLQAEPM